MPPLIPCNVVAFDAVGRRHMASLAVQKSGANSALAGFWRKLVRRLAHTGTTFSGIGTSAKPRAVQ
jgi:hypothetical protein